MKPRIAIFGIPPYETSKLKIRVYARPQGSYLGDKVFESKNDDSGITFDHLHQDIDVGDKITIQIMSSGLCEYSHQLQYLGADISHVPIFEKETNSDESWITKDWDLKFWNQWNERKQHEDGIKVEKSYLASKIISTAPIWESYYLESSIDYFEKFHKLWVGLNAFATFNSNETSDKKKILDLVNSEIRSKFSSMLGSIESKKTAKKWRELQKAVGLNFSSDIVRDEIAVSLSSFDFLEKAKKASVVFSGIGKQLGGLIFLDSPGENTIFQKIFSKYHQYMASEQGITEPFDLANAFCSPYAPESISRYGRLIFHDPFKDSSPGSLFSLEDFFGSEYSSAPYQGEQEPRLRGWEASNPLLFRYLLVLYKFRSAYFHGDLPPTKQNNSLASSAYQSLFEVFPNAMS